MPRLFYQTMQDNAGNLLFGVSGTMRLAGTSTLATIYGDEALTVIVPNPMTNHPNYGTFKCYLGPGNYDFYMAKAGYTFETLTGVQGSGTMASQDATAVVITGGSATFSGPLVANAGATVNGLLTANGGAAIPSTLTANAVIVSGGMSANGAVNLGSTLVAAGLITASGGLTVPHTITVNELVVAGAMSAGGAVVLGGAVAVNGALTANAGATVTGTLTTNAVSVTGLLTANGDATVHGLLTANGGAAIPGTLTANAVIASGGMSVTGAVTLGATLAVNGLLTANAGATVTGTLTTNAVTITGVLNVPGTSQTDGKAVFRGNPVNDFGLEVFPGFAFLERLCIGGVHADLSSLKASLTYNKSASEHGMVFRAAGADTGSLTQIFTNVAGTQVGSISTSATVTAFNTTSDARLKHDIAPLEDAASLVQRLRPVRFRWTADDAPGVGLLAHELQAEIPDAVTGAPDAVDADGRVQPQQVDYSKLVPYLVSAVQTLVRQVETLTARLATLEAAAEA